jgi:hypothetical protein
MGNSTQPIANRSGSRRGLLALTVALLSLASCSAASASPSPAGPRADAAPATTNSATATLASGFRTVSGMNGWTVFTMSPVQRNQQLAAMAAQGVKVVRSDAPWAYIEPAPPGPTGPVYDWAGFDQWVTALADDQMTWEPLIDFSVWWAKTCSGDCPPTSDSTYATYAAAIAARYGPNGTFWSQNPNVPYFPVQMFELWDEENDPTFYVAPARFATLYTAAHNAIHAVDPTASVVLGGLADDSQSYNPSQDYPAVYVYQMFQADPALKGHVDAFGLHPYGTTGTDAIKWTIHFRQVLDQLGESAVPIDITELGWTSGDSDRETWRAWMMTTAASELSRSDCGIRLLAPYDWVNPGADSSSDFGLVGSTGLTTTLRPAGTAWFKSLSQAAALPELNLCGPPPAPPKAHNHHKPKKHKRKHKRKPKRRHPRPKRRRR